MPELNDIIDACRRGDRQSQRRLYDHFKSKMFVLCLRYANSREDAEDILQEGFVKVFRDLHQYSGMGSFEGWVRKVMLNCALQYIRRIKKALPVSTFEHWENMDLADDMQLSFDEDMVKELLRLMQKMPFGFRTVLNLYVMEGFSHQEIADEMGISVGTSKSQLNRAKKHLKDMLSKSLTE